MKRISAFLKTTVMGGLIVVLPVVLTYFFLRWLFNLVSGLISPLTRVVMAGSQIQKLMADLMVVLIIVAVCFLIGLFIKTRLGLFIYRQVEKRILRVAPGYSLFRETIKQFLGQKRRPFSQVALVRVFENSTMMTAFVTDEHPDGSFTVYVPSGLNPTSGLIYHLQKEYVHPVDVPVEETMRSIISCGAGSGSLIASYIKNSQQIDAGDASRGKGPGDGRE
jgi:uncharacterized membrane protein